MTKEFNKIIAEKDRIIEETKRAQSGSDKKYIETARELKATKERLTQIESDLTKMPDQVARLNRIEEFSEKRIKELELKHYSELNCIQRGVPTELLNGRSFDSEADIDEFLDTASTILDQKGITAVEESWSGVSKPRAGAFEGLSKADHIEIALKQFNLNPNLNDDMKQDFL